MNEWHHPLLQKAKTFVGFFRGHKCSTHDPQHLHLKHMNICIAGLYHKKPFLSIIWSRMWFVSFSYWKRRTAQILLGTYTHRRETSTRGRYIEISVYYYKNIKSILHTCKYKFNVLRSFSTSILVLL